MAPSLVQLMSQESINANPAQHSPITSSPVEEQATSVKQAGDERIEDSYEPPTVGMPVQAMTTANGGEEDDDLYDVSPKGKAALDAAKGSLKKCQGMTVARDEADSTGKLRSRVTDQRANGTTTHASAVSGGRAQSKQDITTTEGTPTTSRTGGMARLLRGPPLLRHTQTPASQQGSSSKTRDGRNDVTAGTRAHARPSVSGAAAALQARRSNQAQPSTSATSQSRAPQPLALGLSPLKERNGDVATQRRTDRTSLQTKLASRPSVVASQSPAGQVNGTKSSSKGRHQQSATRQSQPTGRPSGPVLDTAAQLSAYDFPVSPEREKPSKAPKGRGAAAKPSPKKKVSKRRMDEVETSGDASSSAMPNGHKRDSSYRDKATAEVAASASNATRKQPPRRSKGMDQTRTAANEEAPLSVLADKKGESGTGVKKARDAPRDRKDGEEETLEDFENEVVNFDDEDVNGDVAPGQHDELHVKNDKAARGLSLSNIDKAAQSQDHDYKQDARHDKGVIVLSDTAHTSSPTRSEAGAAMNVDKNTRAVPVRTQHRPGDPETPVAMRSSPPQRSHVGATPPRPSNTRASASQKPAIIGFARSGPRNQGTVSSRMRDYASVQAEQTEIAAEPRHTSNRRRRIEAEPRDGPALDVKAKVKKTTEERPLSRGNVAETVPDALSAFTRTVQSRRSCSPVSEARETSPMKPTPARINPDRHTEKADDFAPGYDFDGPTLLDEAPMAGSTHPFLTVNGRTASQIAMPPPPARTAADEHKNQATTGTVIENQHTMASSSTKAAFVRNLKRASSPDVPADARMKRRKHNSSDKAPPEGPAISPEVTYEDDLLAPAKASSAVKRRVPDAMQKTRQPGRQASQGTVDIHGSPIPKDLEVPELKTVLEVFSQKAAISSDEILAEDPLNVGPTTAGLESVLMGSSTVLPKFHPSNSKPVPASPHRATEKIVKVAVQSQTQDDLLLGHQAVVADEDPFQSSGSASKDAAKAGSASALEIALRAMMNKPSAGRPHTHLAQVVDDDPEKTLVEIEPPSRLHVRDPICAREEPRIKHRELPKVIQHSQIKRKSSDSSEDSSDASEDLDAQTTAMRDIGSWRKALLPHQMNLFDELVNVSHRLVAHLVDQETAARHVVDDYRRRGERIVEVMEQTHLREYEKSVKVLKEREKQAHKDMVKMSKELESCKSAIAKAREDRATQGRERGKEVKKLESLLAQLA